MISISDIVLTPPLQIFEERYLRILLIDMMGIVLVIFFTSIDWVLFITQRKIKFVKPKL
jgi:hypothetical protein